VQRNYSLHVLYSFSAHLIEFGAIRDSSPGLAKYQQQAESLSLMEGGEYVEK
jgi:hypothetical protein